MAAFLRLLNKFSAQFSDDDLESLKFLCRENIGKKKLEGVKSGLGLFTILIEQREISGDQTDSLRGLLEEIKRDDLVAELDSFLENGESVDGEQLDPNQKNQLRAAYDVIRDNVGRDWKTLIRRLRVNECKVENIIADHPLHMREQLMQCLRAWEKMKGQDAQVGTLVEALRQSNMTLVADRVEEKLRRL